MHSAVNRIQNVFGFFTTILTVLASVIALLSLITTPVPDIPAGGLTLHNVQVVKGRPHYYSRKTEEYAYVKFDLDVDLNELFTWNTKQVFLYITASYPSSSAPDATISRQIIWDAVLPHPLSPEHHNQYTYGKPVKKKTAKKFEFSGGKKAKKAAAAAGKKPASAKKVEPEPPKPAPGILKLDAQKPKYMVTDITSRLAERGNATLELNWNVQPWVGALTWGSAGLYTKASESRQLGGALWTTWRGVDGAGAVEGPWSFTELKDKKSAEQDAGKDGLAMDKGAEAHRLMAG